MKMTIPIPVLMVAAIVFTCTYATSNMANVARPAELRPIKYEATTNYTTYERVVGYLAQKEDTNMIWGFQTESTNVAAQIIHAVTWGRGTNAVFVLKTSEPLKPPVLTPGPNEWYNASWTSYGAAAWVESVK